ncbi:hypothetical protein SADUNF_Sadunf16G0154900 [Salix dunnii]|uniref:Sm domain-containing protein n=1 Tax=Salix dunnii TaxID=1413687 RepID=A0A835MGM0_9ROSI|nr:hypothetical protein SADUNF_Sadunf16G0154900 [Salix dunnii]
MGFTKWAEVKEISSRNLSFLHSLAQKGLLFYLRVQAKREKHRRTRQEGKSRARFASPRKSKSGRKETVLDLAKFVDKGVQVKLTGGRQGFELQDLGRGFIIGHENITHWSTSHASNCMMEMGVRQILENKSVVNELITGFGYNQEGMTLLTGTLKGYDQLLNLVLDEAVEFLRDADDPLKTTDQTRRLGLIKCCGIANELFDPRWHRKHGDKEDNVSILLQVCRGTAVMLVSPTDGTDEIANPFVQPDGA